MIILALFFATKPCYVSYMLTFTVTGSSWHIIINKHALISTTTSLDWLSGGHGAIQRPPEHLWTSDKPQIQATQNSLGNFQHRYLPEMLVNVYNYHVKNMSCVVYMEARFSQIQSYFMNSKLTFCKISSLNSITLYIHTYSTFIYDNWICWTTQKLVQCLQDYVAPILLVIFITHACMRIQNCYLI